MYSVLVLGLIPGTNIQISFVAWLVLAAIIAIAGYIALEIYYHRSAAIWLPAHYPKDASQLHQRGV